MFDAALCARLLIEDLATARPGNWQSIAERTAAVDAYLARSETMVVAVDAIASKLGIDRRTFFRLLAKRRSQLAGRCTEARDVTAARSRDLREDEIIRAALVDAGPGARETQVLDAASRIAASIGQDSPSEGIVRNRFAKLKRPSALAARSGQQEGILLDACRLGVDTPSSRGSPVPTWLVVAIDLGTGRTTGHAIVEAGEILAHAVALARANVPVKGDRSECRGVVATAAMRDVVDKLETTMRIRLLTSNELRAGEGLQTIFGQQLGRIPLRKKITAAPEPMVDVGTLRSIVDQLIDAENAVINLQSRNACHKANHTCDVRRTAHV